MNSLLMRFLTEEEDPVMTEIMELFALDLYQIRRMKITMDKVKQTFEEHKSDVDEAKLLESLQAAHHLDQEPHPVTEVTSEARNILISYVAFVESYGPYITNAVIRADDDMPKQHLDAYVRGNDSQPISNRLDY